MANPSFFQWKITVSLTRLEFLPGCHTLQSLNKRIRTENRVKLEETSPKWSKNGVKRSPNAGKSLASSIVPMAFARRRASSSSTGLALRHDGDRNQPGKQYKINRKSTENQQKFSPIGGLQVLM